jgi:hypothetical protein
MKQLPRFLNKEHAGREPVTRRRKLLGYHQSRPMLRASFPDCREEEPVRPVTQVKLEALA